MKNIISYGGGTQSTAMILMALNGEYGLPRPDFGVFADVGGEPEFVNEYVRYFIDYVKQKYDFDIYIIQKDKGLVDKLLTGEKKDRNGNFYISSVPPFFTKNANGETGKLMRQCTPDFKIHPITKFINSKLARGEEYRMWIGISFDERSRMKVSTIKRRTNYYPLVDNFIRRLASIQYVKECGVREPVRSSCYFCPFHSNKYWTWLKKEHPSEFNKAVDLEKSVQQRQSDGMMSSNKETVFIHRSCIPLDQVDFSESNQLDLFPELIDECDGYCGI